VSTNQRQRKAKYRSAPGPVLRANFSAVGLWAQIEAIKIPARSPPTPMLRQATAQPSPEARAGKFKLAVYKVGWCTAFVVAVLIIISVPLFWLGSLGLVIVGFVLRAKEVDVGSTLRSTLRSRYVSTESQWYTALEDWERRCGIDRIEGLKVALVEARRSFEGLTGEEREQVAKYQADRRSRQLTSYLERFRIRNVKISGIGPAKEASLASYGIESAADVNQSKVVAVPGFGPTNSRPLLGWRQELERKFVYDPKPNAADHAMLGKIRSDTLQKATQLREQLVKGAKELWKAVHGCEQMRRAPDPLLSRLEASRNQIKADFAFLGIPLPGSRRLPNEPLQLQLATPEANELGFSDWTLSIGRSNHGCKHRDRQSSKDDRSNQRPLPRQHVIHHDPAH
jgi:hypothetical protein